MKSLKPGLFLSVELQIARRENAVLVPEEALVGESTRQFVFVVRDEKAERREVKLGQRLQGEVEIASGLAAGDLVIVRGVQKVRNGQQVISRPLQPNS